MLEEVTTPGSKDMGIWSKLLSRDAAPAAAGLGPSAGAAAGALEGGNSVDSGDAGVGKGVAADSSTAELGTAPDWCCCMLLESSPGDAAGAMESTFRAPAFGSEPDA